MKKMKNDIDKTENCHPTWTDRWCLNYIIGKMCSCSHLYTTIFKRTNLSMLSMAQANLHLFCHLRQSMFHYIYIVGDWLGTLAHYRRVLKSMNVQYHRNRISLAVGSLSPLMSGERFSIHKRKLSLE